MPLDAQPLRFSATLVASSCFLAQASAAVGKSPVIPSNAIRGAEITRSDSH